MTTTIAEDVQTLLLANAALVLLATGGIYTYADTNRLGISEYNTPDVFGTSGQVNPTILIKDREQMIDGGINDDVTQALSYRQIVEIWIYDDGDHGFGTINSIRSAIYTLLHARRVNLRYCRLHGNLQNMRDPGLRYAGFTRSDYMIWGIQP